MKPGGQISSLRNGVDIVIACPGRLEDHVRSGHADLGAVEVTVLDEADHMADLGFLPGVKRLLDTTPRRGQRMLFSATLDRGVDVLVKRYLTDPVTHSVDSAQSPVGAMTHHVLHVGKDARIPVLVDLTAAPGRTIVFTRTKHGAKNVARQLNQKGVPAVELHGNLSQNARTRNLAAFSTGTATTLVATDIAARGIHVDDVGLVVHADPPVEHKAYLHRSGRTARAGNEGTVVTLMLDSQVSDVRDLARKAGIKPTITRLGTGHPLLEQIAPGERTFVAASAMPAALAVRRVRRPSSQRREAVAATVAVATAAGGRGRGRGQGRGNAASKPAGGSRKRAAARRSGAVPRVIRWPPAQRRVVLDQHASGPLSAIVPQRLTGSRGWKPCQAFGTIRPYLSSVELRPRSRRAMISCWICWVPSKMSRILESRAHFSSRSCSE